MILVNMQNFMLFAFLLLERYIYMTSQKFSFQKVTTHRDSIFTPWNRAKLEKNHFMPEHNFSGTNLYPSLHFHGFQVKQKKSYVQFFETSHF